MNLDSRLKNVAVVGAAGKMGSGISLLLALELARRAQEDPSAHPILTLVDSREEALLGLLAYLRAQAVKEGERQVNRLRALHGDGPVRREDTELVQAFAEDVLAQVRTSTRLASCKDARLVFESAFEQEDVKAGIYRELKELCPGDAWFLTNTSSIPIRILDQGCGLGGRIIGFHFFNPPAVQKLLELIPPEGCDGELLEGARALAGILGKHIVPSRDVAGFIGNGHFIREGLRAFRHQERLAREHGFARALHLVDKVSRDFLLRPMGIFQLVDYVGLDVFQHICKVMEAHLQEGLHSELVDRCLGLGVRGGQTSDGAQKDGFLRYEGGRPSGIFDPAARAYVTLDPDFLAATDALLGALPDPALTWKALARDPERDRKLAAHFQALKRLDTLGARMARAQAQDSREVALDLVRQGVAARPEDVNDVLVLGFYHLYGAINGYLD